LRDKFSLTNVTQNKKYCAKKNKKAETKTGRQTEPNNFVKITQNKKRIANIQAKFVKKKTSNKENEDEKTDITVNCSNGETINMFYKK